MNEVTNYDVGQIPQAGPTTHNTQTEMMVSRQAQEVQAAIVIAKRFPRNYIESYNRVLTACQRKSLAESAIYEYPRGNEKVTGPSIRLAEAIAQNWGNIDFGITELEQRGGESQVMAYAWDLETNTRQTKIFTVKHVRHTKKGDYKLTDPRDIYELVANSGARRLRACILGIIPGDVIEGALEQCNKTLLGNNQQPVEDVVKGMVAAFKRDFGVTLPQIEKYIGWKAQSFTMNDVIKMKRVYNSLRDGMAKREDIFDMSVTDSPVEAIAVSAPAQATQKAAESVPPAQQTNSAPQPAKPSQKPQNAPEPQSPPTQDAQSSMFDDAFGIPDDYKDPELPFN